jgi:hypothetical protein
MALPQADSPSASLRTAISGTAGAPVIHLDTDYDADPSLNAVSPSPMSSTDPMTLNPVYSSCADLSSIPSPCPSISSPSTFSLSPVASFSMATFIERLFLFLFHVVPSVLYWAITFTTITLPTWLFTLFSMSLTFTMNFTTL